MEVRLLLFAVFLAGCSMTGPGQVLCTTRCGVRLTGAEMPSGWTCDSLQANEDRFMRCFERDVKDARFKSACARMTGTEMKVKADYAWRDEYGRDVIGLTKCSIRTMWVGWLPSPELTSMGHEYAHIVQDCMPPDPRIDRGEDRAHGDWRRDGIYFAAACF